MEEIVFEQFHGLDIKEILFFGRLWFYPTRGRRSVSSIIRSVWVFIIRRHGVFVEEGCDECSCSVVIIEVVFDIHHEVKDGSVEYIRLYKYMYSNK